MITNERQYRITRKKARKFAHAIEGFNIKRDHRKEVHPRLVQAEREAMKSQLADLQEELEEYERLKSAEFPVIWVDTFEQLADGLIKARIAGGLTQCALAQRLKLKEQQIQRYEAEGYASASYQRLCEVASALQVRIENEILLPVVPDSFERLLVKLSQVGISREFVTERLLPSPDTTIASEEVQDQINDQILTEKLVNALEYVFSWDRDEVLSAQALPVPSMTVAVTRFKVPMRCDLEVAGPFATYANYLAMVATSGMIGYPTETIPADSFELRKRILARGSEKDSLRTVLHTVWDHGVIVLPLRGKGTFYSANWRFEGRSAIVLKQTAKHEARWTFNLLQTLFHASQRPEKHVVELVEEEAILTEESAASQFAGDVMLDGKAEELADECVAQAENRVERLKNAVRRIAEKREVSVDSLANYLAFRLSKQGLNWWEEAASLQHEAQDPWTIARDVFLERHPRCIEDETDRFLLERALE